MPSFAHALSLPNARRSERKREKKRQYDQDEEDAGIKFVTDDDGASGETLTDAEKNARKLIAAGMGATMSSSGGGSSSKNARKQADGFEVVSANADVPGGRYQFPAHYDDEDVARTLAIGTMMLDKTKRRKMIDASYNRYAWSDPDQLPAWFLDDQEMHNRPQLEVSKELMEKMRERVAQMANRPIAKVAEARQRKAKRLQMKQRAAKKATEAIMAQGDMTVAEKKKAIDKAMRGATLEKTGKVYIVSNRNGKKAGAADKKAGGKIKLVDKRMKSDQVNMKKKAKKATKRRKK